MHPGCGGDLAIGNGLGRINYMNVKPSLMKCMGDRPNHGYRPTVLVCKQLFWPTQPPSLCGVRNEYRPMAVLFGWDGNRGVAS